VGGWGRNTDNYAFHYIFRLTKGLSTFDKKLFVHINSKHILNLRSRD